MSNKKNLMALDVGTVRIGVAFGDSTVKIAIPWGVVSVDGSEVAEIYRLLFSEKIDILVVGYPRNQSGEPTAQTFFVENFVEKLSDADCEIVWQDESLTSVLAEQRLLATKKPFAKEDIDAHAATIILQDYIERNYGI